ncbi:hypothetical protein JCM11641_007703 [Rhodosporidiobolus odoratus]
MTGFADLSGELVEQIFVACLSGPPNVNQRQLERLQMVSMSFSAVARRLLFANITVETSDRGARLLEVLTKDLALARYVRTIVVQSEAFLLPSIFSDLAQDDLLRLTSSAQSFDSPYVSFAPLKDGRKPLPAYPSTLRSIRLGAPVEYESDSQSDASDEEDEVQAASAAAIKAQQNYLTLLTSLPNSVQSLKMSALPDNLLLSVPPSQSFPLTHLTSLLLDFVNISPAFLDWLGSTSNGFKRVQMWCLKGVTSFDILRFMQRNGGQLEEVLFKPKGNKQGPNLGNEIVLYCTSLKRLTLGDKACNHEIYPLLPSSLEHLCVSLPMYHSDYSLLPISTEIKDRLDSLVCLELYSQIYFPPTIHSRYPPKQEGDTTTSSLRELRLSHIAAVPGDISQFLDTLGENLYTLALHHISEHPSTLLAGCPFLRRLEVGVSHSLNPSESSFFDALSAPFLHYLRVHFNSSISLSDLISALPVLSQNGLKTLELTGFFPDDLGGAGWKSGKNVDKLVQGCKEGGVELVVNGRGVESFGELWVGLLAGHGSTFLV